MTDILSTGDGVYVICTTTKYDDTTDGFVDFTASQIDACTIYLEKPDGTVVTIANADITRVASTNRFRNTTPYTLDQDGDWHAQGKATEGTASGYNRRLASKFNVEQGIVVT